MGFFLFVDFFKKNHIFREKNQEYNQSVLEPDRARHFVGPDLGPNCLQILSADDTSKQTVK